jgi:copper chaperone CopZ
MMQTMLNQLYLPQLADSRGAQDVAAVLRRVSGVQQVEVNLASRSVRVRHAEQVSLSHLLQALNQAGYTRVAVLA